MTNEFKQICILFLYSQNYTSIIKDLVHYFTSIENKETLYNINDNFINDDIITMLLNNDLQTIINHYLSK
ncbi:hypothetical protein ACEUUK_04140 [Staphylococcus pseudintermedius]|uniref:hypothetical protein n=1 Tax=Staphylococcus pseudintermedius TaxID=283734 RepID=UPI0009B6416A|nr:hypothetical protein [Staphylococcus pseudintermedius]EGQ2851625.1 hypothetical protein [Staphylococcus pseudintermedius]EGQ4176281.1 hypothetical protein [Staphylococcus pseudintermedius]EGQ4197514.1 hypothetical protein [Staphylococcus pseudintermedius]EGQ4332934.1 hypothetical protein [Staphylococcus pseudintermedius]EGQ4358945.1 hypothetical protein [Staphylococcus pseudintermedius]